MGKELPPADHWLKLGQTLVLDLKAEPDEGQRFALLNPELAEGQTLALLLNDELDNPRDFDEGHTLLDFEGHTLFEGHNLKNVIVSIPFLRLFVRDIKLSLAICWI